MQKEYLLESNEVIKQLDSSPHGLSEAQVQVRQEKYGLNKLKEGKKTSLFKKFLKELANFMTIVLIAAAVVSGATSIYAGESMIDTVIILIVVVINAILGVYQESKAESAIASLQEMTAATSKVFRNGKLEVIRSEQLVPGDIIALEAGDSVPPIPEYWKAQA